MINEIRLPPIFLFYMLLLQKMNFYIDESGNTGDVSLLSNIPSFDEQRIFSLGCVGLKDEDVFENYSTTRKEDFMNNLSSLIISCEKAEDESNFKNASEHLRKQFGDRFPFGSDEDESESSLAISSVLDSFSVKPKPYGPTN